MLLTLPRPSVPAGLAIFSCLLLLHLFFNTSTFNFSPHAFPVKQSRQQVQCPGGSATSNIVLSIKTGATEAYDKLPTQLLTILQCAQHLLLFSDLDQDIGSYHIHDVLSRFDAEMVQNHADFALYRKQKEYQAEGLDIRALSKMKDAQKDWRTAGHNAGWALDKYKFLHMIERAWELKPNMDWYVFAETDTYLVWRNLVPYLQQFDPSEPLYLGRGEPMKKEEGEGFFFAHGGTGFVLSNAAMRQFCVTNTGIASRWDTRIPDLWFGDYVVAKALREEIQLNLTLATPEFSGDKPSSLPWGAGIWCKPMITQHHLRPEEVQALWMLEEDFYYNPPPHTSPRLLYSHIFQKILTGIEFTDLRDEWDNLSNDQQYSLRAPRTKAKAKEKPDEAVSGATVEKDPNSSAEACSVACSVLDACFQWSHLKFDVRDEKGGHGGGLCYLSSVFRFGKERQREEWVDEKANATNIHLWTSGWNRGIIRDWLATTPSECGEAEW